MQRDKELVVDELGIRQAADSFYDRRKQHVA